MSTPPGPSVPHPGTPSDEERPILPGLAEYPDIARSVRESLTILREHADGPLRDKLADVLAGGASLRALARDPEFTGFVGPLADQGYEMLQAERAEAATASAEVRPAEPRRPEEPGGTW